jgi:hypothetical protein
MRDLRLHNVICMLIAYVVAIQGITNLVCSTQVREILNLILGPVNTRTMKLVFAGIPPHAQH